MSELTTTQETVLLAAAGRTNGSIHPMPTNIRGGAATKVTAALVAKNLIDENGVITTLGLNVADPNWNAKPESTGDAPTSTELTMADAERAYVEADAAYEAAAKAYTDADNALNKALRKGKSQAIIEQARETVAAAKEAANQTAEVAMTAQAILDSFAPQATTLETDDETPMALPIDDEPATAPETDNDFEEDVTTAEATFNEPSTALVMETAITLEASAALACPANFEEADPEFMAIAQRHFSTITPENWPAIRNTIEEAYSLGFEQAKARKAKTTPTRQASTPRTNSKKAMVLEMLKRTEGATIEQITEVTGWQVHTIRAFLSVAKSKLGMNITTNHTRMVGPHQPGASGSFTTYFAA